MGAFGSANPVLFSLLCQSGFPTCPHNLTRWLSGVFYGRKMDDLDSSRLRAGCASFRADWPSNGAIRALRALLSRWKCLVFAFGQWEFVFYALSRRTESVCTLDMSLGGRGNDS